MGIDADYQALPEGSAVLAYALEHPALGGWLMSTFDGRGTISEVEGQRLYQLVQELFVAHPGLETRHYDEYSRHYDMLNYLLSEPRRSGQVRVYDLGTILVRGAEAVGTLVSGQGFPLRWTSPDMVQRLASWIEPMTRDDLRQHYDLEAMEARGVYKFHASDAVIEWEYIWDYFTGLRTFYQKVAEHNEGVLITFW